MARMLSIWDHIFCFSVQYLSSLLLVCSFVYPSVYYYHYHHHHHHHRRRRRHYYYCYCCCCYYCLTVFYCLPVSLLGSLPACLPVCLSVCLRATCVHESNLLELCCNSPAGLIFRQSWIIGHFHDCLILLQLPELISAFLSDKNFVIPAAGKYQ